MEHKYIDADALERVIYEHRLYFTGQDDDVMTMYDIICEMPAADVEPVRHGKWIEDDYGFFHCSECGFEWDESERTEEYCPNCGARNGRVVIMDEGREAK